MPIYVISFTPGINRLENDDDYPIANDENIGQIINNFRWKDATSELYNIALSAIESLSSIRKIAINEKLIMRIKRSKTQS